MPPTKSKTPAPTSPKEYIEWHGYAVDKVIAVWSAGESDLGGETFLFVHAGRPYTAVEIGDEFVVRPGWNQFNPVYFMNETK